jgi:hypothetical protein
MQSASIAKEFGFKHPTSVVIAMAVCMNRLYLSPA